MPAVESFAGHLGRAYRRVAAAAMMLAVAGAIPAAHGQAGDFAAIKAEAAKEGRLVVWHNTPKQETTDALAALFNQRFGMNVKIERVSTNGGDMTARLIAEKRGGKFTIDMFIATDRQLPQLVKNGLIAKIDWLGLFAGPGKLDAEALKGAVSTIMPEYQGYGLELRDTVFGIAYNTKLIAEKDVPTRWEDIGDAKWSRKLIIDDELSPLARLLPAIGRDAVLSLARKIVANRPVYADGQPSAARKLSSGEAPIGAFSLSSAQEEKQKGAPVGLVFAEPQGIISQQLAYVPSTAPHPNLARLWAAWLTSEAMATKPMLDEGIYRAWPGSPGPFGDYAAKHDVKIRRAETIQELEDSNTIRRELNAVVAGRAP
jgi:ABC-type Fe3+ transport system substrate-binding protein